jgi:putative photosynthetic complex assembly protein
MTTNVRKDTFPRGPLIGAAVLVLLTLGGAGLSRLTAAPAAPDPTPVALRDLWFADRTDGAVLVYRAGDPTPFRVVTGQAGFLRGTLRALVRERRLDRVGGKKPFRLCAWPDGRLTLEDTATGERIELEAFGADNAAVFAQLLTGAGGRP